MLIPVKRMKTTRNIMVPSFLYQDQECGTCIYVKGLLMRDLKSAEENI
jgi:hypothetical protein